MPAEGLLFVNVERVFATGGNGDLLRIVEFSRKTPKNYHSIRGTIEPEAHPHLAEIEGNKTRMSLWV